ncbi:MAG: LLM class F420-dependent oxidoreductase [Acidimicrobiales bacterium]|nr:LLM class F420-dependent oxidoreductase [Acidimicrobiales bacterium]
MPRPFRFAIQAKSANSRSEWVEQAKKIEDLGYSSLSLPDHFDGQLSPTPALMAAADATTTLRVGALVWCNDYRHPVTFASEMATLDVLSEGRLELGIGAGWMKSDYDAAGMSYDRPGVRIERMMETVEILRGLFDDGPFSHSGNHYTVTELDLTPKPVQHPVPILIGGGGPRMLRLAGKHADIVGVNPNLRSGVIDESTAADATAERYAEKVRWVKEGAGDRFENVELQIRIFLAMITDDRDGTADALGPGLGMDKEAALASPLAVVGTTEQIAETLIERREIYGFSYITLGAEDIDSFAPVVARLVGT